MQHTVDYLRYIINKFNYNSPLTPLENDILRSHYDINHINNLLQDKTIVILRFSDGNVIFLEKETFDKIETFNNTLSMTDGKQKQFIGIILDGILDNFDVVDNIIGMLLFGYSNRKIFNDMSYAFSTIIAIHQMGNIDNRTGDIIKYILLNISPNAILHCNIRMHDLELLTNVVKEYKVDIGRHFVMKFLMSHETLLLQRYTIYDIFESSFFKYLLEIPHDANISNMVLKHKYFPLYPTIFNQNNYKMVVTHILGKYNYEYLIEQIFKKMSSCNFDRCFIDGKRISLAVEITKMIELKCNENSFVL